MRGKRDGSGRFTRYVPIGERRDNAYRVERQLLAQWGDLSTTDGYLQRSANPPLFRRPGRFPGLVAAASAAGGASQQPEGGKQVRVAGLFTG